MRNNEKTSDYSLNTGNSIAIRKAVIECADDNLRNSYTKQLEDIGISVYSVSSNNKAVNYCKHHVVDLIILHSDNIGKHSYEIIQSLRHIQPKVKIVLTRRYFDYWNDFRSWCADACLLLTSDLSKLNNTIKLLLCDQDCSTQI